MIKEEKEKEKKRKEEFWKAYELRMKIINEANANKSFTGIYSGKCI